MARIFVSHSSRNNAEALALREWLVSQGWMDLFLDIDPISGLVAADRWQAALRNSIGRCRAVIFCLSPDWLASQYCISEFNEAMHVGAAPLGVIIKPVELARIPGEMTKIWQIVDLTQGGTLQPFVVAPPPERKTVTISFPTEELTRLRTGLARLGLVGFETRSFSWPPQNEIDRAPYRGLSALDETDAGVFFGRDSDLIRAREALLTLRGQGGRRLFAILGASGAGKSSFLRAGLLPRLAREDRDFTPLPIIRPRDAPLSGDTGLAQCLATTFETLRSPRALGDIKSDLRRDPSIIPILLAEIQARASERLVGEGPSSSDRPPTLVIPIDQAEELTATGSSPETRFFMNILALALRDGPEFVALVTIRSDRFTQFQELTALYSIPVEPFNLPPVKMLAYKEAIEGPALRLDPPLKLTSDLVDQLLTDTAAQGADPLPMLAFMLQRLYVNYGRATRTLQLDHYLALGGLTGSLEAAVENAFADSELQPPISANLAAREQLLEAVFVPALVDINEFNNEPLRRIAAEKDLPAAGRGIVERLVQARLLVRGIKQTAEATETTIEVAHEALLRQWKTLRELLSRRSEDIKAIQAIERSAATWEREGQDEDWLDHKGDRLSYALKLASDPLYVLRLTGRPTLYLSKCSEMEDRSRRERERAAQDRVDSARRLARRTLVGLAAALVLAILAAGLGFVAWSKQNLATEQAARATEQAALAAEQAAEADRQRKEAEAQRDRARLAARDASAARDAATAERDRAWWNQSIYLARTSSEQLTESTVVGGLPEMELHQRALLLAIEALENPQRGQTRPYTPQAHRALFAAFSIFRPLYKIGYGGATPPVFVANGAIMISSPSKTSIDIHDTATGRVINTITLDKELTALSFSKMSKFMASLTEDGVIEVWSLLDNVQRSGRAAIYKDARRLFLAAEGGELIVVGRDNTFTRLRLDGSDFKPTARSGPWQGLSSIKPSSDLSHIVIFTKKKEDDDQQAAQLFGWSGQAISLSNLVPSTIVWHPSKNEFAAIDEKGQVVLLHGATGRVLQSVVLPKASPKQPSSRFDAELPEERDGLRLAYSASGHVIAVQRKGAVYIYDAATLRLRRTAKVSGEITAVWINEREPDLGGSLAFTSTHSSGYHPGDRLMSETHVSDLFLGNHIIRIPESLGDSAEEAIAPSGNRIITRSGAVWSLEPAGALPALTRQNDQGARLFGFLGNHPYGIGVGRSENVTIFDLREPATSFELPLAHTEVRAFIPDKMGVYLALVTKSGGVTVANMAERRALPHIEQLKTGVKSVTFDEIGQLYVLRTSGRVDVFDLDRSLLVRSIGNFGTSAISISASRASQRLAVVSEEQLLTINSLEDGEQLHKVEIESPLVNTSQQLYIVTGPSPGVIEFNDEGTKLAAAAGAFVFVIDVISGKREAVLIDHVCSVRALRFVRGREALLSSSADLAAAAWDLKSGAISAAFEPERDGSPTTFCSWRAELNASLNADGKVYRLLDDGYRRAAGGRVRQFDLGVSASELLTRAKREATRCLVEDERREFLLDSQIPYWCEDLKKFPTSRVR